MVKLGHRPGLDGVRGLAVLLVLVGHAGFGYSDGLEMAGVEVFFVLSGFLITSIMLERPLVLREFYLRRARRLLPALVAAVTVVGAVSLLIDDQATATGGLAGLGYIANLARIDGVDLGRFDHLWSLAVEEHFYLAWPLVVLACRRNPMAVGLVAASGVVLTALWRQDLALDGASWDRVYHGTDTRITGILLGAVLAVDWTRGQAPKPRVWVGVLVLAAAAGSGLYVLDLFGTGLLVVDAAAVALVAAALHPSMFDNGLLRWAGRRSYALYLWHLPIFGWTGALTPGWSTLPAIAATVIVAEMSWRFVERRWLGQPDLEGRDAPLVRPGRLEVEAVRV